MGGGVQTSVHHNGTRGMKSNANCELHNTKRRPVHNARLWCLHSAQHLCGGPHNKPVCMRERERERERESKAFPYRHGPTDTKVHAYVAVMDANDSRDDGIER